MTRFRRMHEDYNASKEKLAAIGMFKPGQKLSEALQVAAPLAEQNMDLRRRNFTEESCPLSKHLGECLEERSRKLSSTHRRNPIEDAREAPSSPSAPAAGSVPDGRYAEEIGHINIVNGKWQSEFFGTTGPQHTPERDGSWYIVKTGMSGKQATMRFEYDAEKNQLVYEHGGPGGRTRFSTDFVPFKDRAEFPGWGLTCGGEESSACSLIFDNRIWRKDIADELCAKLNKHKGKEGNFRDGKYVVPGCAGVKTLAEDNFVLQREGTEDATQRVYYDTAESRQWVRIQ